MGTAVFRDGQYLMFCGSSPAPSFLQEGDEVITASSPEDAIAAYDTATGSQIAATTAKRAELAQWFAGSIAAGYDTGLGFSLMLGEQDQRILFDYQQRLLRQIGQGAITLADIRPIKGTDGSWHLVTVEQFIDALDAGAAYIESLNGAYAGYELRISAGDLDFTPGVEPEPEGN